jgi:hypothetical protein
MDAPPSQQQHQLSLKVMRLSKPTFFLSNPTPFEPSDSPISKVWEASAQNDPTYLTPPPPPHLPTSTLTSSDTSTPATLATDQLRIRDFGLSEFLSLPASFGNIYLGETFSSYLCINNESSIAVQAVGIKAELQTSSQRFTLADTLTPNTSDAPSPAVPTAASAGGISSVPSSTTSLLPTQSAEFLIHHEIKELGIHILVCSIHYTVGSDRKFFRKFYKFQVLNPLTVKTKVNSLQDGRAFLEAQVQNVAGCPMYLERLQFEASDLFDYVSLNMVPPPVVDSASGKVVGSVGGGGVGGGLVGLSIPSTESGPLSSSFTDVFLSSQYLNTLDTRQYLYMLVPKIPNDPLARSTPTLGKLDIMWKTSLGQTGRLQTSQLSRKIPPPELFEVLVVSAPKEIHAEQPFKLNCKLRNNSPDTLRVVISGVKSKMSSVLLWGPSERYLGDVAPRGEVEFQLEFFPLLSGLHKVTGIKATDALSNTSKDLETLADVFVL